MRPAARAAAEGIRNEGPPTKPAGASAFEMLNLTYYYYVHLEHIQRRASLVTNKAKATNERSTATIFCKKKSRNLKHVVSLSYSRLGENDIDTDCSCSHVQNVYVLLYPRFLKILKHPRCLSL